MIVLRDRKGRLWTARLTVGAAKRMRDLAGFDVMGLATDDDADRRLDGSPGFVVDALFALFLPECERRGLTDRRFGGGFRGVPLASLVAPLRSEVREFFRVPGPPEGGGSGRPRTREELWLDADRMAGLAGIDPDGKTFGELVAASEGKRRHDWPRTALVLAQLRGLCGKRVAAASLDPTGVLAEAGGGRGGRLEIRPDNLGVVAAILGVT